MTTDMNKEQIAMITDMNKLLGGQPTKDRKAVVIDRAEIERYIDEVKRSVK